MSDKRNAVAILRTIVEFIALLLAFLLLLNNKLQLWLIIFSVSAILSVLFGRFYCSWICPMNTFFRIIDLIYSKLGIKRFKTPKIFRNNVLRFILLIVFIATMVVTKIMQIKINVLILVTGISVLLTMIFEEAFWHRRLCPFGSILSLISRKSFLALRIDKQNCISCGKCQIVCPVDSIITTEDKKRQNTINECLVCGKCQTVCPKNICVYQRS